MAGKSEDDSDRASFSFSSFGTAYNDAIGTISRFQGCSISRYVGIDVTTDFRMSAASTSSFIKGLLVTFCRQFKVSDDINR